jgi:hypothetical protein
MSLILKFIFRQRYSNVSYTEVYFSAEVHHMSLILKFIFRQRYTICLLYRSLLFGIGTPYVSYTEVYFSAEVDHVSYTEVYFSAEVHHVSYTEVYFSVEVHHMSLILKFIFRQKYTICLLY